MKKPVPVITAKTKTKAKKPTRSWVPESVPVRRRLGNLTRLQLQELAAWAECSPAYLRHVSAGRRRPSSLMAIRLEHAGQQMGVDLRREEMSEGCSGCEFAVKCRGSM